MRGRHDEYTVEVRKVANGGAGLLYVFAGKSGLAYQCGFNELEEALFSHFVVPQGGEIMKTILDLVQSGYAVRYYEEERRVSVDVYFAKMED